MSIQMISLVCRNDFHEVNPFSSEADTGFFAEMQVEITDEGIVKDGTYYVSNFFNGYRTKYHVSTVSIFEASKENSLTMELMDRLHKENKIRDYHYDEIDKNRSPYMKCYCFLDDILETMGKNLSLKDHPLLHVAERKRHYDMQASAQMFKNEDGVFDENDVVIFCDGTVYETGLLNGVPYKISFSSDYIGGAGCMVSAPTLELAVWDADTKLESYKSFEEVKDSPFFVLFCDLHYDLDDEFFNIDRSEFEFDDEGNGEEFWEYDREVD